MGERTEYEAGTFCWVELATTDPRSASGFYAALLGWDTESHEMPGGGVHMLARLAGHDVAGLHTQGPDQTARGIPPNWLSYVSVDDAAAAAERVAAAGGRVIVPPVDAMGTALLSVVADPQGAVFGLWQRLASIGATLVNDPGCLTLNQLNTPDPEAAAPFYREVFGWDIRTMSVEPPYWGIFLGERVNGGMMPLDPAAGAPPHWLAYFTVRDMDEAGETIRSEGGRVLVPPMPVGEGQRILVAIDAQGAWFALYEGRTDP